MLDNCAAHNPEWLSFRKTMPCHLMAAGLAAVAAAAIHNG